MTKKSTKATIRTKSGYEIIPKGKVIPDPAGESGFIFGPVFVILNKYNKRQGALLKIRSKKQEMAVQVTCQGIIKCSPIVSKVSKY